MPMEGKSHVFRNESWLMSDFDLRLSEIAATLPVRELDFLMKANG